jgi:hypothetical protein
MVHRANSCDEFFSNIGETDGTRLRLATTAANGTPRIDSIVGILTDGVYVGTGTLDNDPDSPFNLSDMQF